MECELIGDELADLQRIRKIIEMTVCGEAVELVLQEEPVTQRDNAIRLDAVSVRALSWIKRTLGGKVVEMRRAA